MAEQDMLNHLASKACPITEDAKSECNAQFSTVTNRRAATDDGSTVAAKFFDQIQGAGDGSLVEHAPKERKQ